MNPGEQFAHGAVTKHRHVIDGICPGNHAGHQWGDLQPGIGSLVDRDRQVLIGQALEVRGLGKSHSLRHARPTEVIGGLRLRGCAISWIRFASARNTSGAELPLE